MRLLQQLGVRAYYDEMAKTSAWPVPLGMSPYELSLFGADCGILYERPERGDIFLQRSFCGKDVIHAGLVMTVNGYGCLDDRTVYYETSTIEGDTDHRGLTRVWPHLQVEVERCARKITRDRDERDDLIQEARLELWRVDASRCDLRSMDDLLCLRAMLTNHMRKVAVSRGLVMEAPSESVPADLVKSLTQGSLLFAP